MALPKSTLTADGRTSVPAEIRRKLGVGPGSILEWDANGENIVVRRAGRYSFEDLHRAIFATPPRPRTLEELKQGILRHAKDKGAGR
jgi:AbrB family looped-hinge helix DNA binding protein